MDDYKQLQNKQTYGKVSLGSHNRSFLIFYVDSHLYMERLFLMVKIVIKLFSM